LESKSKCLHNKPTVNRDLSKVGFLAFIEASHGLFLWMTISRDRRPAMDNLYYISYHDDKTKIANNNPACM